MTRHTSGSRYQYTIKTLWGLAKSPELHLTDELLYDLVNRETGKNSLRNLTKRELAGICNILQNQKDGIKRQGLAPDMQPNMKGNPATSRQRKKITELEEALGWSDSKGRLRGLAKKMFGIEAVEWLTYTQCSALIEALKAILKRQEDTDEGLQGGTDS